MKYEMFVMLVYRCEHVEFVDVESGLQSLHRVCSVDDVSEVCVASIFRVEVRRMGIGARSGKIRNVGREMS
jgi:hypothetical protein